MHGFHRKEKKNHHVFHISDFRKLVQYCLLKKNIERELWRFGGRISRWHTNTAAGAERVSPSSNPSPHPPPHSHRSPPWRRAAVSSGRPVCYWTPRAEPQAFSPQPTSLYFVYVTLLLKKTSYGWHLKRAFYWKILLFDKVPLCKILSFYNEA